MSNPSLEPDGIASALARARAALGITQNELHKRTGISREAIKGYESGRNKPGAREIKLLCEALQISPNQLLFGTESPFESKGSLYELMHSSGHFDWSRFAMLFNLLTAKEKESIIFIVESILLGRHSQEEIQERFQAGELFSAMFLSLAQGTKDVQEGAIKSEDLPQHLAGQLDKFLEIRTKEWKKKPG